MDNIQKLKEEIDQITQDFDSLSKELDSLQLNLNNNQFYQENIDSIDKTKKQLHDIIDQYFKDLSIAYINILKKYPSQEAKNLVLNQIEQTLQQLGEFQTRIQNQQFNYNDHNHFSNSNFEESVKEVQSSTDNLLASNTELSLPNVKVSEKILESLQLGLNQLASVIWAGDLPKSYLDKIHIENYSNQNVSRLPFLSDKTLCLYDISSNASEYVELKDINLPQQASVIVSPDGQIFILGGIINECNITNQVYSIDKLSFHVEQKKNMFVKRVGHSICYAPDFIYVIGGRTNEETRTKLCERYSIQDNEWIKMPKMIEARSRATVVYHSSTNRVYTFFGTNSDGQNISSCEQFDIKSNEWSKLRIPNFLPGFDISFGSGIEVNEDQLLIFGGLRNNFTDKNQMDFNHKLMVFNVKNDSITVMDSYLPIDFLPLCTPIQHDKLIYAIGTVMSCIEAPPLQQMWLDGAFILEIGEHGVKVINYVEEQQIEERSIQQQQ